MFPKNPTFQDFKVAAAITAIMSALTYLQLEPSVGIDDANITQVYADRLANGQGFRYNLGGELVEGSTSLLWTLSIAPFFWVNEAPEGLIALLCAALTLLTVAFTLKLARTLATIFNRDEGVTARATAAAFLLFPSFFVWSVWPLMDVTLWVCLLTGMALCSVTCSNAISSNQPITCTTGISFATGAVLVCLTRPEGMVMAFGVSCVVLLHASLAKSKSGLAWGAVAVAAALVTALGVTLWRVFYFGYPLPNTVYAKVSTGWLTQFAGGLLYLIKFLGEPMHGLGIAAITAASLRYVLLNRPLSVLIADGRAMSAATLGCLAWGILLFYVAAGGDNFGSFRFYQPIIPMIACLTGLACSAALSHALVRAQHKLVASAPLAVAGTVLSAPCWFSFVANTGGIEHEFRLAEHGRAAGTVLNTLSWQPTVGVLAAGGIARTYEGHIFDLFGLNWIRMAHAVKDLSGTIRNHGSFDKEVFFEASPDIFVHNTGNVPCSADSLPNDFDNKVILKGLLTDQRFVSAYTPACYRGLVFFVRRDLLGKHTELSPLL